MSFAGSLDEVEVESVIVVMGVGVGEVDADYVLLRDLLDVVLDYV